MAGALVPSPAGAGSNYAAGGMSFLQLVQRLRQECGCTGSAPTTTENLLGEPARLAAWISSAWMDIQTLHPDWEFMRQPVQFNTVAGQQSYSAANESIASFGNYKRDSFRLYIVGQPTTEQILPFLPYETFRDMYLFGPMRAIQQRPQFFTIDPQKNFVLGHTPDAIYTVNGEAYALPTEFANDDDRPAMPSQFHMAIVYRAMMFYGLYESASEVYQHGQLEYGKMLGRLQFDQLPRIMFGAPLA